jgi:hypothetical protein
VNIFTLLTCSSLLCPRFKIDPSCKSASSSEVFYRVLNPVPQKISPNISSSVTILGPGLLHHSLSHHGLTPAPSLITPFECSPCPYLLGTTYPWLSYAALNFRYRPRGRKAVEATSEVSYMMSCLLTLGEILALRKELSNLCKLRKSDEIFSQFFPSHVSDS